MNFYSIVVGEKYYNFYNDLYWCIYKYLRIGFLFFDFDFWGS